MKTKQEPWRDGGKVCGESPGGATWVHEGQAQALLRVCGPWGRTLERKQALRKDRRQSRGWGDALLAHTAEVTAGRTEACMATMGNHCLRTG